MYPGYHSQGSTTQVLNGLGARFTQKLTNMGPVTTTVLDDTCGNLIQIQAT